MSETFNLHLELRFDGAAPTGHARLQDGDEPRAFSGWVGLVCVVEALINESREPVRNPT